MRDPPPNGTHAYDVWAAEDKGPNIMILCWTFVVLATVFMAARLYVRVCLFRALRSDDWWCVAGTICAWISTSMTVLAVAHGNGRHYQVLSTEQQERVRFWTLAAFCPGVLAFGFPKFAVVSLLTRLLNPSRRHIIFLWGMCTWCLLTLFATVGTLIGQCTPTRAMWNFDMEKTCVDQSHIVNFSLYAGAMSAFVDLYLAVYPAVILFQLQMKLRRKMALTAALGIGCVGGAIAIYKTTRIPAGLYSPDFSYDSSDLINWTMIESSTIIIAATIPILSPLMDKIFRRRNPFASTPQYNTSARSGQLRNPHHYANAASQQGSGDPYSAHRLSKGADNDDDEEEDDGQVMELRAALAINSSEEVLTPKREKFPSAVRDDLEAQRQARRASDRRQAPASARVVSPEPGAGHPRKPSEALTRGISVTKEVAVTRTYGMEVGKGRMEPDLPWEQTPAEKGSWPLR